MKVAYFIGSLNRGGTEMLVLDTFRKKDCADYEPILIYRNEGELSEAYRSTGVPMFRIKPTKIKIGYIHRIRRLLKQERVDILHTQTHVNAFLGVFCTCLSKVKLVVTFHGFMIDFMDRIFAQLSVWSSESFVFVSEYLRDWYLRRLMFVPKKRCHVVYNGIDFSKFDNQYDTPDFLKEIDKTNPEILKMAMVGNFVGGRSQIVLCRALNQFKDKGIAFRFYFVGKKSESEPELYDNCVSYCRENGLLDVYVFFVGGRGDVPAILQHVDAFVYSTNRDTFGIAVIEAIASGLPTVVNDWSVMKEVTDDGELASLYRTLDVDDCANKIEEMAVNIGKRKERARCNAEVVRLRFSIENHIRNLCDLYRAARS